MAERLVDCAQHFYPASGYHAKQKEGTEEAQKETAVMSGGHESVLQMS